MFGVGGTSHIGQGADLQAKHSDAEFLDKMSEAWRYLTGRMQSDPARTAAIGHCMGGRLLIPFAADTPQLRAIILYYPTPAIQGPLWQSFIANGQPVEWHFFSDANHGFRHPDNAGFQPHYADLTWPLVTSFLQRQGLTA